MNASKTTPRTMHLVINTHWDREWRWSFGETQMRLVEAMDLLIDTMEKDPRFRSFLADSQAAIVDDYLEKRPENRERLRALVRAGRLFVGPWYTLPALYLASGESIVRNLLIGHRLAAEAGGVMKAAYNVFSWGQISQLPQIYRQFGMDTIMFYRGLDQSRLERFEYHWEGPDGSRLLGIGFGKHNRLNFWSMVYQPWRRGAGRAVCDRTGSAGFLTNVCDPRSAETNHRIVDRPNARDLDAAAKGLAELRASLEPRSSTEHLLFLQGTDLDIPDPAVADLVDELNARLGGGERIEISSMPAFMAGVRKSLEAQGLMGKLPVLRGERLDVHATDPDGTALLAGVYSARMNVKLANHRAQICLGSWAEPAACWAALHGAAYPRAFLDAAWKALCQNQQHDGVGGCHVDRVTLATEERYRTVEDIGETVTRNALSGLAAKVDASHLSPKEVGLLVFNPHAQPASGAAECFVDFPHDVTGQRPGGYREPGSVELRDAAGREVDCQVLEFDDRLVSARMPVAGGDKFPAVRFRLAFPAGELPAMGCRGFTARFVPRDYRPLTTLSPRANVLENEHLRAVVNGDGTVDLLDKATGREFRNLGYFEDGGEEGGPLMHVAPKRDAVFTTLGQPAAVSLVTAGPVVSVYRIEREWSLPEGLEAGLDIHIPNIARFIETQRPGRSARRAALRMVTEVSLEKGARRLEFRTRVWNTIRDHRLRAVFPTGVRAERHSADSPFDIVERPVARPDSRGWHEEALRTWPAQSFVDLSDGAGRALAVLHAGIPEYEVLGDESRSIALTLLRSFGAAGGVADTYTPQPLAQLPGEHESRYAVHPHAGDCRSDRVWREARDFTVPLRVVQCTAHRGELPFAGVSFAGVDSDDLVVTALKQSEDGRAFVLRCFNPTSGQVRAAIRVSRPVVRARSVTLEEKPLAELPVSAGAVPVTVAPGQVLSVELTVG
ncbi:MAG TPA: glycoside hydrolase family 38 C-terminal domain-containing protein [Planctomycetota bacterium]|nr:glycoside hydrolase family 38 C-terminal domain-containing protein [Planctomycetota bacterium]